jgi:hypothetical protein
VRPAARDAGAVALSCAACAVAAAAFGPDANWDLRNYHHYIAWAWWTARDGLDLAPAQAQTWFNPLLWVPGFLLGPVLGPIALAALVGALQGLCAAPLLAIAARLLPDVRFTVRALAVGAGLTAATFIGQIGASYGDVLLGLLLLCAIALLLESDAQGAVGLRRMLLAGALLGAAPALKLAIAPVALGLCLALPLLATGNAQRLRMLAAVGSIALLVFLLLAGPWMWRLWQDWGNPLFPQFDTVFGNQWLAPDAARDLRFLPADAGAVLLRPLAPLVDWRATSDYRIRDARIPMLALAIGVLAWRWRRIDAARRPALAWLAVSAVLAYAAWLALFGYHRYLVTLEMLAPILLCAVAAPGVARRAAVIALVLAIAVTNPPNHERTPDAPIGPPVLPAGLVTPDTLIVLSGRAPTAHVLPDLPQFAGAVRIESNLHGGMRPRAGLDALIAARIAGHRGPLLLLVAAAESGTADGVLAPLGLHRDGAGVGPLAFPRLPRDDPGVLLVPLRRGQRPGDG